MPICQSELKIIFFVLQLIVENRSIYHRGDYDVCFSERKIFLSYAHACVVSYADFSIVWKIVLKVALTSDRIQSSCWNVSHELISTLVAIQRNCTGCKLEIIYSIATASHLMIIIHKLTQKLNRITSAIAQLFRIESIQTKTVHNPYGNSVNLCMLWADE